MKNKIKTKTQISQNKIKYSIIYLKKQHYINYTL
jgi:hypothetical protein